MVNSNTYIRDGRAPIPKKEITSKVMSSIKDRNTKPEIMLRKAFWKNNIRGYRLHWKKVPGRPDIAFPGRKIAVFVHGCFWHRCPHCQPNTPKSNSEFWQSKFEKNVERDKKKLDQLKKQGWKTLVMWECQIKSDIKHFIELINSVMNERC